MIDIDFDKPRKLHFGLAEVRDLEAAMNGRPLAGIINDLSQLGVNAMVLALWAGLKHEDRTLNPKLVERMLEKYINQRKSLRVLGRALNDALEATGMFRSEAEEEQGNVTAEAAAN